MEGAGKVAAATGAWAVAWGAAEKAGKSCCAVLKDMNSSIDMLRMMSVRAFLDAGGSVSSRGGAGCTGSVTPCSPVETNREAGT